MKLDAETVLIALKEELPELSKQYGVRRIGLFGSVAHGQVHSGSDIDILVAFDLPSFDHYMDLKFHLEDRLGCRVDLVMETALKPALKEHILREVRYAA